MAATTGVEAFKYRDMINSDRILLDGAEHLRYQDLHDLYANSQFGQHHALQPARYSADYGYDREQMILDLGDDVHPVRHMLYTESLIARPLMAAQNSSGDEKFEPEQVVAMRMAALLHDVGECEHPHIVANVGHTVGDVSYEVKTQTDGDSETLIRQFLYGQLYSDIPRNLLDAADDVIDHKEGSLSREAFNTMERLGYYITAIRAGETALKLLERRPSNLDLRITQLGRLALRVTENHRSFLQERTERFPYLEIVLKSSVLTDARIHRVYERFPNPAPQAA